MLLQYDRRQDKGCLLTLKHKTIMAKSKTIVLIHGNFVNNISWTEWKRHYEQKGYKVHTPANLGHEGNPAELRAKVHPDLIKTGFIDIVNNIAQLINTLPEKPLIIGHSMAGMATLKLVEMGKAAAGVSIDGAPPKNVFPPFQTLKTVLPAFGFFSLNKYQVLIPLSKDIPAKVLRSPELAPIPS